MSKLVLRLSAIWVAAAIVLVSFAFNNSANAALILYGIANGGGTGEMGSGGAGMGTGPGTGPANFSQLVTVDPFTAVPTIISQDVGFSLLSALAADSSGTLYSISRGRGPNDTGRMPFPSQLFTIDPVTGLANAPIGQTGIEFGPPQSAGQGPGAGDFTQFGSLGQNASDMSFDPTTGELYGMAARGSQLFTVDSTTGLATRSGTPCVTPIQCARGNALAFDSSGTLFWANQFLIATLDPATGLVLAPPVFLDFSAFGETDGEFRVVGMAFHPETGELYTSVLLGEIMESPPATSFLAILDWLTGTFSIIGNTGIKLEGLAFVRSSVPIAEPSTLALFGTGLLVMGLMLRRRRKTA